MLLLYIFQRILEFPAFCFNHLLSVLLPTHHKVPFYCFSSGTIDIHYPIFPGHSKSSSIIVKKGRHVTFMSQVHWPKKPSVQESLVFSLYWIQLILVPLPTPPTPLHSLWKDASDEVIGIMIQLQSLRFMKGRSWVKVNLCLLIIIVSPSSRKDIRAYTEKSVGLLNIPSHKITSQGWCAMTRKLSWNLYVPLMQPQLNHFKA